MEYLYFKGKAESMTRLYDNGQFISEESVTHPRRQLPFFVILLGSTGRFDICENGTEYALLPGTYLLLLPDYEHYGSRLSSPNISEYFCNFTIPSGYQILDEKSAEETARRILAENLRSEFIIPIYAEFKSVEKINMLVKNLIEASYARGPYSDSICEYSLNTVFSYLSQEYIDSVVPSNHPTATNYLKMHKILKWINLNYPSDITVSNIAEHFHYNPMYLTTAFKTVFGIPISKYITSVRVNMACSMLSNTALPIKVIAYNCGFKDSKYFSKVFREFKGITPSTYRNAFFDYAIVEFPSDNPNGYDI